MKNTEIEKKFVEMNNDEERNVANLLLDLGLVFVDSNKKIGDSQEEYLGEIDLLFTSDDYLFLIEVSKEKCSNEKKFTFFTKWADKDILEKITNQCNLKVIRVYFDLSTKTPENKSPYLQILTKYGKMNKVAYIDDYEKFLNLIRKKEPTANRMFLDWIKN